MRLRDKLNTLYLRLHLTNGDQTQQGDELPLRAFNHKFTEPSKYVVM